MSEEKLKLNPVLQLVSDMCANTTSECIAVETTTIHATNTELAVIIMGPLIIKLIHQKIPISVVILRGVVLI